MDNVQNCDSYTYEYILTFCLGHEEQLKETGLSWMCSLMRAHPLLDHVYSGEGYNALSLSRDYQVQSLRDTRVQLGRSATVQLHSPRCL
jgi:hypothetical protein